MQVMVKTAGRNKLRDWLKKHKKDNADAARLMLASRLAVSESAVDKWLNGTNTPRIRHALRLQEVTGIKVADWLK